jgi:hypothetical protein
VTWVDILSPPLRGVYYAKIHPEGTMEIGESRKASNNKSVWMYVSTTIWALPSLALGTGGGIFSNAEFPIQL